jgi:hypothetical protein
MTNEFKLVSLRKNDKKNTWVANFECSNKIQVNNVKISANDAMNFIIKSNNIIDPILDEKDKNIIIYNF